MDNLKVADVVNRYVGEESVLSFAKRAKISRHTIKAWQDGRTPDLGMLLKLYFDGTDVARKLALDLLHVVRVDIYGFLVYMRDLADERRPSGEEVD